MREQSLSLIVGGVGVALLAYFCVQVPARFRAAGRRPPRSVTVMRVALGVAVVAYLVLVGTVLTDG